MYFVLLPPGPGGSGGYTPRERVGLISWKGLRLSPIEILDDLNFLDLTGLCWCSVLCSELGGLDRTELEEGLVLNVSSSGGW